MLKSYRKTDALFVIACTLAFNAFYLNSAGPSKNAFLGAEYDSIARAIRAGRGFADPFEVESGPTAWMPPVLPCLLASFYVVASDDRDSVITLVLILKGFAVAFSGWVVVREARRLQIPFAGYLIFPIALWANSQQLFRITQDTWLLLFVVNCMWYVGCKIPEKLSTTNTPHKTSVLWGIFGGVVMLCSPVLGGVWILLTSRLSVCSFPYSTSHSCNRSRHKPNLMFVGIAFCSCVTVICPWSLRNKIVFDRWIPVKSNAMFEVWQSLCLDDDGLIDDHSLAMHPFSAVSQRDHYIKVGEIDFVEEKSMEVCHHLRNKPTDAFKRIGRRANAAFLEYHASSKRPKTFTQVFFAAPFVAAIVICLTPRVAIHTPFSTVTLWIYFAGLLPYVIISYNARYPMPLFAVKLLLVIYSISLLRIATHKRTEILST